MSAEVNCQKLRNNWRGYLDHVASTGTRVVITRHGQAVAALVSLRDLRALEEVDQGREEFMEARHQERMKAYRRMRRVMERE
ncbi:type II toxin-antitoxin system Phd/YefM family antitoxin [Roseovarius sp. EL26]|uniref:type II toxin-antitoxin system Phd/YefM family antitoxin n=1 Tax=Roseovarius sp. EL26 TaxID=2126672 RepID=UPI000EA1E472|nr:type II toxin-antitoxin system Phd/YefM family antitoxin [Roseovarius sp. EL26]